MKKIVIQYVCIMIALFLVSCGMEEKGASNKPDMQEYVGNYVTDGYARTC